MERKQIHGTLSAGTRLFNRSPDSITNDDADEFINLIQEQRRLGYGFVPLIGAGFSAPSGVPLINEIGSYVNRCIVMAMGAMSFEPPKRLWNPRTDQWPPLIDIKNLEEPGGWKVMAKGVFEQRRIPNGHQPLPLQDRYDEALGVMSNWCTALLYLSRLTRESFLPSTDGQGDVAALDAPQPAIVDACFREALKDKSPTLGHRMLAVLAGALRLDLILTTNFDDLIEHGFAASGNALQVCEVQLGSDLPQWSSVRDVRTLIKLHGNRQGLRADYSLDGYPSQTDKQRLLEYLRLDRDEEGAVAPGSHHPRNHMLVLGHSVQERRTRALIEHAWCHLDASFRVFWVCYSKKDVERVQAFTSRFADRHRDDPRYREGVWEGSCVLRYPDAGLFLLQLYQRMRRNLPAHTGLFPSVSRLSFPPLESRRARIRSELQQNSPEVKRFSDQLTGHLRKFRNTDEEFRFVVAASDEGVHGVTTACADIYRTVEEAGSDLRSTCLWVDMNDMSSADNLFETLLEAAYFRLGQEHWTPCYVESDKDRPRSWEIERLVSSFNYPCVIFLNARETPGANTLDPEDGDLVHGWLDKQCSAQPLRKRSNDGASFCKLIIELCGQFHLKRRKDRKGRADRIDPTRAPSRRISVVLMCRQFDESSPLWQHMQDKDVPFKLVKLDARNDDYSDRAVVTDAIKWAGNVPARQRFLHALVLMQRPRPLATIWTAAASLPRKQAINDDERVKWLNELEERGLIRRKAGGFIWIHSRSREGLRKALHTEQAMEKLVAGSSEAWSPWKDEPVVHAHLAEWYARVLDSSSAPAAAFEVAYHLCRAAGSALEIKHPRSISWAGEKIVAARSFLRTHRFLIQTRGYSRESCRRLEHIRKLTLRMRQEELSEHSPKAAFNEKLNMLARTCTEIMRAIAREVGEDSKAYQRHKELALLYIDPSGRSLEAIERDPSGSAYTSGLSKQLHGIRSPDNPWALSWLQWLRWWRWLGMLGIASRSFGMAEDSLRRALHYATAPSLEYEFDRQWNQWTKLPHVQPLRGELGSSRAQELRIEVLRIAEQYVALQLLRQSVSYRLRVLPQDGRAQGADDSQSDADALKALSQIEGYIVRSLKLGATIRDNDDSRGSYDTVTAVWCQSRLLMHRSACKVRRLLHRDDSLYLIPQTAMGLLGDAEACLRVADPQRHRSDLALVDLYRAEVQLCRVEALPLKWEHESAAPRPATLAELCRILEELPKKTRSELRRELPWLWTPPANLRELQVLVMDALRYFTRAEVVLRERRRNVWWTTWFFERKLRAIAASVWLSIFEPRAPIPFLGFEAAASGVDTAADSLLNIGWRMIRVDAYRLATIIDAYGSCAKALHMRLRLDDPGREEKYFGRQSAMSANLTEALDWLDSVLKARITAGRAPDDKARVDDKARMDDNVHRVVMRIQSKNTAIAEAIMPVGAGV